MTGVSILRASVLVLIVLAAAPQAEFDVATVKVSAPVPFGTTIAINLRTFRNGMLTMTNVTLGECVQFAYSLVSQDQVVGPDWIKKTLGGCQRLANARGIAALDRRFPRLIHAAGGTCLRLH